MTNSLNVTYAILLCTFVASSAYSQGMQQVLPRPEDTTGYYYTGIDCSDDHNCSISVIRYNPTTKKFSQHVERTTDGGVSWVLQDLPPRDINLGYQTALRGAVAVDSSNVFVFGDSCYIAKTSDAGRTWTNVSFPSEQSLLAGNFISPLNGTIVGTNGIVLRTTTSGTQWERVASMPQVILNSVRMWDEDHIALFHSYYGSLMWTNDGFATFDTSSHVIDIEAHKGSDTLHSVDTPLWYGKDTLVVPGNSQTLTAPYRYMSTIYRSTNRGKTWSEIQVNDSIIPEIMTGSVLESGDGVLFGKGYNFLKTSDFGKSWESGKLDEKVHLAKVENVHLMSPNEAIITLPQGGGGARVFLIRFNQLRVDGAGSKMRLGTYLYPNPTSGNLTIEKWYTYTDDVRIVDLFGRVALRTKINAEPGTSMIDCSKLPNGSYNVVIKHEGADLSVGRFILMK